VETDWRADLLSAVHAVFARELEGVRAEVHSYSVRHPADQSEAVQQLESIVKQQV